jgi:tetratricopeptide (TPR) repeat protein
MRFVMALSLLLAAFPAAARVDPAEESFKKADLLIEKGDYSLARDELDDIRAGLKIDDPELVRYHERTGASWLREGKIVEARASFTAALMATKRLAVNSVFVAKAYTGMGLCLRRESNDKYALKFFKKALGFKLDEGTKMFAEDQIREIEGAPPLPAK